MYDAINKGMRHAKGDILAYLNSDDLYFPWTLEVVVEAFGRDRKAELVYGDALGVYDDTGAQDPRFQPRSVSDPCFGEASSYSLRCSGGARSSSSWGLRPPFKLAGDLTGGSGPAQTVGTAGWTRWWRSNETTRTQAHVSMEPAPAQSRKPLESSQADGARPEDRLVDSRTTPWLVVKATALVAVLASRS